MSAGTHAGLDATVKVTVSWGGRAVWLAICKMEMMMRMYAAHITTLHFYKESKFFFLLYSHAMCTTSLKVITWPGQKGERISSRERSDGPKSSLTGCTNTSGGAPPCDSLPRQTIVQSLEQHWVDKSRRKRLGGPGELTVSHSFFLSSPFLFLLSTHPTHSWNYGTRAAVAVCSPTEPTSATPLPVPTVCLPLASTSS